MPLDDMNRRQLIKAALAVPVIPVAANAKPEGKVYRTRIHFDGSEDGYGEITEWLWLTADQKRRIERICWE